MERLKDALLWDLYQTTSRALRRGLENPIDRRELVADTQRQAREILYRNAFTGRYLPRALEQPR